MSSVNNIPVLGAVAQYPGTVGPTPVLDGWSANQRMAKDRTQVVQDGHGRYTEVGYRGNAFYCTNSAAQALSLTGTTTYTGLVVYNKPGSGKNLALLNASYAVTIAETGVGAIILFSQAVAASLPSLTATNVANMPASTNVASVSSAVSVASVASSCTLAANPIFMKPCISVPWVTGTAQAAFTYNEDLGGLFLIPPGAGVGFVAVTTALTGIGMLVWEEIPI